MQLQQEVIVIKHELEGIKKRLNKPILEPIIIEAIAESELTPAQRKQEKEALADFRAGRRSRFVTIDEARKILHITGK